MSRKKKVIEADVTRSEAVIRTVRPVHENAMATWDIGDRQGRIALLQSRMYEVKSSNAGILVVRCPLSGHLFSVDALLVEDV
jgi:hypothetical protein